ncbi:8-oxo-dGTP diphosphatase [Jeotgalicoccus sp. ATCC 8456]|uniref:8-oxo-dGTP diphosphatase n=1 Tax=Jeotgalicoccus sp. ATCC 8456 TaxID=946435 RepID=UPI0018E62D81|nr:8-oxo-dGTP diphosphatase [Jeotgalicoccus sp. ATCC 8456]QQD84112.1 8-oxo-dGTP diphosphatase [Jeotgalicoccus sp. ATCC 8456]
MPISEKAIITNMCMIENEDGQILVQNRNSEDWPGVTFPGGKVEKNESFVDSVVREVFEETGLTIHNPQICGTKQFQTDQDERYIVLMYRANQFSGTLRSSDEGEVFWINKNELNNFELANDFEEMFRVMDSDSLSEFYYDDSWNIHLK